MSYLILVYVGQVFGAKMCAMMRVVEGMVAHPVGEVVAICLEGRMHVARLKLRGTTEGALVPTCNDA